MLSVSSSPYRDSRDATSNLVQNFERKLLRSRIGLTTLWDSSYLWITCLCHSSSSSFVVWNVIMGSQVQAAGRQNHFGREVTEKLDWPAGVECSPDQGRWCHALSKAGSTGDYQRRQLQECLQNDQTLFIIYEQQNLPCSLKCFNLASSRWAKNRRL